MFNPNMLRIRLRWAVPTAAGFLALATLLSGCAEYNDPPFTPGTSAEPAADAEGGCLVGINYIGDRSRTQTEFGKALAALAQAGANGKPMEDGGVEFVLACGGSEWGDFSTALREMRGDVTDRANRNGICANNFYPPNLEALQGTTYADEHTTRDIRNRLATGGDASTLCEAQMERAMEADKVAFWIAVPSDHGLWRATGTQPAP